MRRRLLHRAFEVVESRKPDEVIKDGYLLRWWLMKSRASCLYLHCIMGDDDDRALHDHRSFTASVLLEGSYYEHLEGGIAIERRPGAVIFRAPQTLHRLTLADHREPVWSLFYTGPHLREWGFQCPKGWIPWKEFDQGGCS